MSKVVPGVEASAPLCPSVCVLIDGMLAVRPGCLSPYPPMENWFELYAPCENPVSEFDGFEACPGNRDAVLEFGPFMPLADVASCIPKR